MGLLFSILGDAAVITLLALTLGLTSMVASGRLYHFAAVSIYALGAYGMMLVVDSIGRGWIWLGVLVGVGAGVISGLLIEVLVYRSLRRLNCESMVLLLASLGVMVVVANCVALVFGNETQFLPIAAAPAGFYVFGTNIGAARGLVILAALLTVGVLHALLRHSSIGLSLRAAMSDSWLATTWGLRRDRLAIAVAVVAGACAASAGMYAAVDWGASPWMGFRALLYAVVCVVVSGSHRMVMQAIAAVALSAVSQVVAIRFSGNWQDVLVFGILVIWLIASSSPLVRCGN